MPDALAAYTMILLRHGERYLMLERAGSKRFAPGRWTGLGGRVEPDEFTGLHSTALRELREETGIEPGAVRNLVLRRALLQIRPEHPLTTLLYFTGDLPSLLTPQCPEGTLHWLTRTEIAGVDVIENTALVIPLLIADLQRDPDGMEPPVTGAAEFNSDGSLCRVTWSREPSVSGEDRTSAPDSPM